MSVGAHSWDFQTSKSPTTSKNPGSFREVKAQTTELEIEIYGALSSLQGFSWLLHCKMEGPFHIIGKGWAAGGGLFVRVSLGLGAIWPIFNNTRDHA